MNKLDEYQRAQLQIPEPGLPLRSWLPAFLVMFISTTVIVVGVSRRRAEEAAAKAAAEKAAHHKKAEELTAAGYEQLRMAKRNQLSLRCIGQGDYPLFFLDKVVCIKKESVSWDKRDENPKVNSNE